MKRTNVLLTVAVTLGLAALASTPAITQSAGPDLVAGDAFTYERKGNSFTQVYEGTDQTGNHVFRISGGKLVYSPGMALVERPGTKVSPHNAQIMLNSDGGLRVGDRWETSYTVKNSGGTSEKTRDCKVVAHKAKKVKAGSFDAYRVDCDIKTVGKGTRYSQAWFHSRTWRMLTVRVGKSKNSLRKRLELTSIKLKDR